MIRLLLLAGLALLLSGVPVAAAAPPPTRAEAALIADRFVAKVVPNLPNYCAGGRLRVTYAPVPPPTAIPTADGWANGWRAEGAGFRWDPTSCDIGIRTGLDPRDECKIRAHELLHIMQGPEHVGVLALARNPDIAPECYGHTIADRAELLIRKQLPAGYTWRVVCNASAGSCRARAAGVKFVRRFAVRAHTVEILGWTPLLR